MARFKNHYQTLGVADFSSPDEIKSAYRKLARAYHPDLNIDNPSAEEQFKAVNEAYSVLGSSDKRPLYDSQLKIMQGVQQSNTKSAQSRQTNPTSSSTSEPKAEAKAKAKNKPEKENPPQHSTPSEKPPSQKDASGFQGIFDHFLNKEHLNPGTETTWQHKKEAKETETKGWGLGGLNQWFKKTSPTKKPQQQKKQSTRTNQSRTPQQQHRGEDITVDTRLNLEESRDGVIKTLFIKHHDLCQHCQATGKVNHKLCKKCHGEKTIIREKKVDVHIPSGVQEGSKVRVAGEGGRGINGGDNGDLYLLIRTNTSPHEQQMPASHQTHPAHQAQQMPDNITIKGLDAYSTVSITPEDAALGGQIVVETLNKPVSMAVPSGCTSGKVLRLKGLGVKDGEHQGDHYVTLLIEAPKNLSAEEKALYEQLRNLRSQSSSNPSNPNES